MPRLLCSVIPRSRAVNPGICWTLLGINIFLLISGTVMVVIGLKNAPPKTSNGGYQPDLWWFGVMPLAIGFAGVIAVIISHPKWLLVWAIYSVLVGAGSYIFFVKSGCLDPEAFGVTLRIFGTCYQETNSCICSWSTSKILFSKYSCKSIRTTTSIYITQIILLTLTVAFAVIGCFLASLTACCAKWCILQNDEEQSLLHPSTSQSGPSCSNKRAFKTDYVAPSSSKSYVSDKVRTTTTML